MSWVRLDDQMPDHPKLLGVSDAAFRLHVHALCYSARQLTDGRVPGEFVRLHRRFGTRYADELVAAGVWVKTENHYEIHDYTEYQPSRAKVLAERESTANRVQEWRERKRKSNGVTQPLVTPDVTPPPSHPIPLPPNPRTAGEQENDLEQIDAVVGTPRANGTNPRARNQRSKAQRSHERFVDRTVGIYHQWLAEDGQTPDLVADQIRQAYPDIAEEVLAKVNT